MLGIPQEQIEEIEGYFIDKRTKESLSILAEVNSGLAEVAYSEQGLELKGMKGIGYLNGAFVMGLPFTGRVWLNLDYYPAGLDVEGNLKENQEMVYFRHSKEDLLSTLSRADANNDSVVTPQEIREVVEEILRGDIK